MNEFAIAVVLAGAALVEAVAVIGSARVSKRQLRLQQINLVSELTREWELRRDAWQKTQVICLGPNMGHLAGLPEDEVKSFRSTLEAARSSRVTLSDALRRTDDGDPSELPDAEAATRASERGLDPYRNSVESIAMFLNRLMTLVLRGELQSADLYEIVGTQVAPVAREFAARLSIPLDSVTGCPGPFHSETEEWRDADIDEVCRRIGWGEFLVGRGTTHARILTALDLIQAEAILLGDSEHVAPELDEPRVIATPAAVQRLATLARPFSSRRGRQIARQLRRATVVDHRQLDLPLPEYLQPLRRWRRPFGRVVDDGRYRRDPDHLAA